MAATKISGLSADASPATTDYLVTVDVSDTTMAGTGTNKKVLVSSLITLINPLPQSGGTMTGALLVDDGTTLSALPLAFDGDPNTGMYRSGADAIGIVTAGAVAIAIDSSQVVTLNKGLVVAAASSSTANITLNAQDGADEGGQLLFKGALNGAGTDHPDAYIDRFATAMRFISSGNNNFQVADTGLATVRNGLTLSGGAFTGSGSGITQVGTSSTTPEVGGWDVGKRTGDAYLVLRHGSLTGDNDYAVASNGTETFIGSPAGYAIKINPGGQGNDTVWIQTNSIGSPFLVKVLGTDRLTVDASGQVTVATRLFNNDATTTANTPTWRVGTSNAMQRVTSRREDKEYIEPINFALALALVQRAPLMQFGFRDHVDQLEKYKDRLHFGSIVDMMEDLSDELNFQMVDYVQSKENPMYLDAIMWRQENLWAANAFVMQQRVLPSLDSIEARLLALESVQGG